MHIQSDAASQSRYLVRASYLQIYNEVVSDLLKPEKSNLVIHEDAKRGVHVHGLSEWVVRTPDEVCIFDHHVHDCCLHVSYIVDGSREKVCHLAPVLRRSRLAPVMARQHEGHICRKAWHGAL